MGTIRIIQGDIQPGRLPGFPLLYADKRNLICCDNTIPLDPVCSNLEVDDTFTVVEGVNDTIVFMQFLSGEDTASGQLTAVVEAGIYSDPDAYAAAVCEAVLSPTSTAMGLSLVNYM